MMNIATKIVLFGDQKVRKVWFQDQWYFSVIDVVGVLSGSDRPRKYRNDVKTKLKKEGSEVSEKIGQLKLLSEDGKFRQTDTANTQTIFRIIQSIPSPNAEPFKLRLAKVGYERVEETEDPELGINRALQNYINKGYDENRINQRLKTIEVRKQLTDERKKRGILHKDYAILTDEITKARAGMSTREYKIHKGLKKENLRDNMSNLELILNMLAEASTTEISQQENPNGFEENKKIAKRGGSVSLEARKKLEQEAKKKVISDQNYLSEKTNKVLPK